MNIATSWYEGLMDAEVWEEMKLVYTTNYGIKYTLPANHGFSKSICMPHLCIPQLRKT